MAETGDEGSGWTIILLRGAGRPARRITVSRFAVFVAIGVCVIAMAGGFFFGWTLRDGKPPATSPVASEPASPTANAPAELDRATNAASRKPETGPPSTAAETNERKRENEKEKPASAGSAVAERPPSLDGKVETAQKTAAEKTAALVRQTPPVDAAPSGDRRAAPDLKPEAVVEDPRSRRSRERDRAEPAEESGTSRTARETKPNDAEPAAKAAADVPSTTE